MSVSICKLKLAVDEAIRRTWEAGAHVARYDVEQRKVYYEYPDGRIEYLHSKCGLVDLTTPPPIPDVTKNKF